MTFNIIEKLQNRLWNWMAQNTFHADVRFLDKVRFLSAVHFEGPRVGFYGVNPIERPVLPKGAGKTVDDVIEVLQSLGLVKQS